MCAYNPQSVRYYADVLSTVAAMVMVTDQTLFMLFHYNSYANNPVMLRSSKPMVMRDIFLTKSSSLFPNPLSCIYVTSALDCFVNSVVAYTVAKPLCLIMGWRHTVALYFGAGFFSSFAYLFSGQINKSKFNTEFDCACTSNGSYAGFATLSLFAKNCFIPFSKGVPAYYVGVPYLMKCAYDEYVGPKFVEKRKEGNIEVRNWGCVGGVFFSLMYASLFLRTKGDIALARKFFHNIKK